MGSHSAKDMGADCGGSNGTAGDSARSKTVDGAVYGAVGAVYGSVGAVGAVGAVAVGAVGAVGGAN